MTRLILLFISVIVATLFTLKAFLFEYNGYSTIELIDRLPLLVAPANYVYYIWLAIFILLFFWIYQYFHLRGENHFISNLQTILFILVVLFQIASLWSWHSNLYVSTIVILLLQVVTLFGLYLTYPLKKSLFKLRMPIAVYFGWSTFLLILNCCYFLVHMQWSGFGLSNALWAVIVMTIGTAIALHLRFHHFDVAYPIVFIWCYLGIAAANGFGELLVTTAALFLAGVIIVGIFFMKKNPVHLK
ncbi:hypothetical protein D1B33_13940 [Lysinibacillus yapensis]|uniref:Tryptophan-rich sensory protein n=1 Tax=Ureibacillus yapensis TaxID=2304605 RepID=A0A396S5F4_9BACL|nr:hypothetical protein [Lysinibacillus yapensis]RHW34744.1 hypothetical protein D1B33_13940 [Lysinibacillus yapensis]